MLAKKEKNRLVQIAFLTVAAGVLNGGTVALCALPVSHMTGNITQLGLALNQPDGAIIFSLILCLLSFFIGSLLAGILLRENKNFNRRLIIALFSAGLVLVAAAFFQSFILPIIFCTSLIMGWQNAVSHTFRSITVRTTHLTGYFTDAGLALSKYINKRASQKSRLFLFNFLFFLSSIVIFLMGATAASFLVKLSTTVFLPYLLAAACYFGLAIFLLRAEI